MADTVTTNGLSKLWMVLGPIAITLVLAMSGTYFLFLDEMVVKSELMEHRGAIERGMTALIQDVKRIEATQNQRASSVSDVPSLRQEINRMIAEVRAQEVRLEDLRSRVLMIEDMLRKKSTLLYLERVEEESFGTP